MMVLGYSHALHSIGGDCVGLSGAQAIAGELYSSRAAHLCTLAHAHLGPLAHARPATLV